MKETELRRHAACSICGRKIGETGLPLFWVVKVQRFGLDLEAIRRQAGLTMMLGGSAVLAGTMGSNEEMAKPLTDERVLTVCDQCAFTGSQIGIRALERLEREGGRE